MDPASTGARVPLGSWPTPVQDLAALSPRDAVRLYAKREDLAAPDYGGNKVRKLEHVLAALPPGAPIVTVGAVGSHHVVATALYGRRHGHPCWAALGPQPDSAHVREHGRIAASLLAGWEAVPRWAQLPLVLARLEQQARAATGQAPLVLPPGGSSVTGTLGAVDLGLELARDVAEGRLPRPDHVYVPVGSGGTAAGLWVGLRAAGLPTEVVGVRVVDRAVVPPGRLRALAGSTLRRLSRPPALPLRHNPLRLVHDHFGPGYGAPLPEGVEAARLARERAGLALEQTYSAKTLAACLDAIRRQEVGGVVVFVATASSRPLAPLLAGAPAQLPDALDAILLPPGPIGRAG